MDKRPASRYFHHPAFQFTAFLLVRLGFVLFSGYNNYVLQEDSSWYVGYADAWLRGEFNFDIGRFILSPGYVWFLACCKTVFGAYWESGVVALQLIAASLSGVYFYKLGKLLFNETVAGLATAAFCVLPLTFWWVHTFTAESLFQSLFILSLYYFLLAAQSEKIRHLLCSALLIGSCLLLKSHVILFTPFIALYYFLNGKNNRVRLFFPVLYGAVCVLCLLPFTIYCWKTHQTFVLSSNGGGYQFYLGNTEAGYVTVVDPPEKGTPEFDKLQDIVVNAGYFNGDKPYYDSIMARPQAVKQQLFRQEAMAWIDANPKKFWTIKFVDAAKFLLPGISFQYYPFTQWLLIFLIYGPLYFLAYFAIILAVRREGIRKHLPVAGLFVSMLLFSVIWYVQNRFRTITIEPLYILYATWSAWLLLKETRWGKRYFTSS